MTLSDFAGRALPCGHILQTYVGQKLPCATCDRSNRFNGLRVAVRPSRAPPVQWRREGSDIPIGATYEKVVLLALHLRHPRWPEIWLWQAPDQTQEELIERWQDRLDLVAAIKERDEARSVLADACEEKPTTRRLAEIGRQHARLRGLIKNVEWGVDGDDCPWCHVSTWAHDNSCPAFTPDGDVR